MESKVVWITGASGGIGCQTVQCFAEAGVRVAAGYHTNPQPCFALQEMYPDLVLPVKGDLSLREEVTAAYQTVCEEFGRVDVLVNNAGIAEQKLFTDITDADWQRMLDVNLKSAFLCSQAVLPEMIRRKSGKIINVSSVWGEKGASCEVHYSVSKAGLIGLTKALAKEEGLSGITVNCVAPGVIETQMNAHLTAQDVEVLIEETPLSRIGLPKDVAEIILFLASERADFITGQVIGIDGGFGL